jgi:DNA-binding HxlR family transcriptional regulator
MDALSAKTALVSRCPRISDGAKVTMVEILFHIDNGTNPSLNELKRIRNVSKSTIQAHMKELVENRILKRTVNKKKNNSVTYGVRKKVLLKLNGLENMHDVESLLLSQAASEQREPCAVKSLIKDPANWNVFDAWNYFNALGKRKGVKECLKNAALDPRQRAVLQKLMTALGGSNVCRIMEKFFQDYRRMNMPYTVESLAIKKLTLIHGKSKLRPNIPTQEKLQQ